jgi:hypothetical protein
MHTAHADFRTYNPYLSWHEWYNMQNETAMGTEKCVMITFAYSITNTAFITCMILYEMVSEWKNSVTKKQLHYSITEFTLVWDNNFFLINHLKNGGMTLKLTQSWTHLVRVFSWKWRLLGRSSYILENVVYMSLDMSNLQWGRHGIHTDQFTLLHSNAENVINNTIQHLKLWKFSTAINLTSS